ncbi:cytochrome P450 [Chytridium lagenaria]|nr:cytochrome P450 [Chytridium lagenaria]
MSILSIILRPKYAIAAVLSVVISYLGLDWVKRVRFNSTIPGFTPLPIYIRTSKMHEFRDILRQRFGIISRYSVGNNHFVYLGDAEAGRKVLRSNGEFIRRGLNRTQTQGLFHYGLFILPTDETWKRHRKSLQPSFGPSHLRHTVEAVNQVCDSLFSVWDAEMTETSTQLAGYLPKSLKADMFAVASSLTLDVLGKVAFSYDFGSVDAHRNPEGEKQSKLYHRAMEILAKRLYVPPSSYKSVGVSVEDVTREMEDVKVVLRKDKKSGCSAKSLEGMATMDALDRMLEDNSDWTDEEILDEVFALFLAGGETTANSIVFAIYLLDQHPEVLERMQDEIEAVVGDSEHITWDHLPQLEYTECVIKETLRLRPTVTGSLPRIALVDTEILGHPIRKGTNVIVDVAGIQRNEKYWKHPESFIPTRWLGKEGQSPVGYLPFLDGPHQCIGMKMAMLELKTALPRLVRSYRFLVDQNQKLELITATTHGFKKGMMTTVYPKQP